MNSKESEKSSTMTRLVAIILGLPWIEILAETWKYGSKLFHGMTNVGIYEVIDYETTLELHDVKGERATIKKREKVRYLQNNIDSHQDQAWGDGVILMNYRCSPGIEVDRYRSGHKTIRRISHNVKYGDEPWFSVGEIVPYNKGGGEIWELEKQLIVGYLSDWIYQILIY